MSDPAQLKKVRGLLDEALKELVAISPESLVQRDRLGEALNFQEGIECFQRAHRLFVLLQAASLDDIPIKPLNAASTAVQRALVAFKQILNFDPASQSGQRTEFIMEVRDRYDEWFGLIHPVLTYGVIVDRTSGHPRDKAEAVMAELESLRKKSQDAYAEMIIRSEELEKTTKARAKEAMASVQIMAEQAGVAQQAAHFKLEADKHRIASRFWLGAFLLSIAGAFLVAWWVLDSTVTEIAKSSERKTETIALIAGKAIIFSLCYYFVIWLGRAYRANRHNFVVNRHRENALKTFKEFVNATSDEEVRSTVILESARCVFAPQQSGYLSKESQGPSASGQIIEVVRRVVRPDE